MPELLATFFPEAGFIRQKSGSFQLRQVIFDIRAMIPSLA
jgi:hypothetical protein